MFYQCFWLLSLEMEVFERTGFRIVVAAQYRHGDLVASRPAGAFVYREAV